MTTLPDRIRRLDVSIAHQPRGALAHQSQLVFTYLTDDAQQPSVGLLMPPSSLVYTSNTLFPVMDQNLPEGFLFQRLREAFPKQPLTAMHLLALIGENGIGRLGFHPPGMPAAAPSVRPISKAELLRTRFTPSVFDALVQAYLSTGIGIAGMQPKILVPDRLAIAVPNVIVKAGSPEYPGLAANEYLCLQAARLAQIETPGFELSDDGQLLLIDRFDLNADGSRLGFEDIAALMGLSVRDTLSDRKYQSSYEAVADVLKLLGLPDGELQRLFEQVAFTVMVRNGDGHLKNFGVLYSSPADIRMAPMFDVVTTAIYRYTRYEGGPELEDKTLALKLFRGKGQTKTYPTTAELLRFGRDVCRVIQPAAILVRIAEGMTQALAAAGSDARVDAATRLAMAAMWEHGLGYAREVGGG